MLVPWKESCDKPRLFNSRHITLPRKVYTAKASVFLVVMNKYESFTIKKGWVGKSWCFWIVVLEKRLRVHWTARRSNQSLLKEINPEYSLKGLMWKLTLQQFGHLMQRTDSFEKTVMLGKIEGKRRTEQQRVKWLAQLVKNPSVMQETLVWFLGQKDPLEKRKATHCSILAWRTED